MTRRILVLQGMLLALAGGISLRADGSAQEGFHRTQPLSAQGRVSLENINGDVHIRAWDRNEVRIDAIKRADHRARLEEARIVVESGPDSVSIKTQYPAASSSDHPPTVEYTLTVPRGAHLDQIRLINGALDIEGVAGEVRASSVNGNVRAERLAGDARLSTVNGGLEANFDQLAESRSISLESVNGSIVLSIPAGARAEFTASNITGGIQNDFGLPVNRGHFVGSSLRGVLKGGGTHIRLKNVNGGITILPTLRGRKVRFT